MNAIASVNFSHGQPVLHIHGRIELRARPGGGLHRAEENERAHYGGHLGVGSVRSRTGEGLAVSLWKTISYLERN